MMENTLLMTLSPIAFSIATWFMNMNGTPMTAPPTRAGIAGSFIATAMITNSGGIRVTTLMFEDA